MHSRRRASDWLEICARSQERNRIVAEEHAAQVCEFTASGTMPVRLMRSPPML